MADLVNPDHESFQAWRLAHPSGFVLNGKTLHVADCKHFGAMTRPRVAGRWDLGKSPKVCATSKEAITGGYAARLCADCRPDQRVGSLRGGRGTPESRLASGPLSGSRVRSENTEQRRLEEERAVHAEPLSMGTGFELAQTSCRNCGGRHRLEMVYPLDDDGHAQQPVKWCRACRTSLPHQRF